MEKYTHRDEQNASLTSVIELISDRCGLVISEREREKLQDILHRRMKANKLPSIADYLHLLNISPHDGEWIELLHELTVGETYFFRDKGQINLLKERLLPELIERNRDRRGLRIWSAGCSTGEELYSVAILVDQLLPQRDEWKLVLYGTDIDRYALSKAREGIFGDWSFRQVDPHLKLHYFSKQGKRWRINDPIRDMVTFAYNNLVADDFPSYASELHEMDLVICRNVFIYFSHETIKNLLPKFTGVLSKGGYLLTGHNELHGQIVDDLHLNAYNSSFVYQHAIPTQRKSERGDTTPSLTVPAKSEHHATLSSSRKSAADSRGWSQQRRHPTKSAAQKKPIVETSENEEKLMLQAEAMFQRRDYEASSRNLLKIPDHSPHYYAAQHLLCRCLANLGRYQEARECALRMTVIKRFDPLPCYLLAHIDEALGEMEEAKRWLHKVIYLDHEFITAYLDLTTLYLGEGNSEKVRQLCKAAISLLRSMPSDTLVGPYGEASAGELLRQLEALSHSGEQG